MNIGYIRVSTTKQNQSHQEAEIKEYACRCGLKIDRWVEETISSRKALKHRKLGLLLNELQENDTIIACEISRLGRSLLEVMGILETCLTKKCKVITIKEGFNLGNDIQSQVLAFAFGLSAQIERNLISQRTKMALDNLKSQGKCVGRPLGAESKKLKLAKNAKYVKELLNKGVSKNKIAKAMGVQKMTLRRFIQRMGW